jgi:hypothetical protein
MRVQGRTPSPLNIAARSNVPPLGFYDPRDHGGSWLTVRASVPPVLVLSFLIWVSLFLFQQVNNTFPAGLGEPINVVLLGTSDPAVLVDQQNNGGLRNYFLCAQSPPSFVLLARH